MSLERARYYIRRTGEELNSSWIGYSPSYSDWAIETLTIPPIHLSLIWVKSVEGFDWEFEGFAEQLMREDPKVKFMITPDG